MIKENTIRGDEMNRYFKTVLLIAILMGLLLSFIFIGIVSFGMNEHLQMLWVTTAMTTNSHKWLATSFVPQKVIDQIMEETKIDDSGYESEIFEFQKPDKIHVNYYAHYEDIRDDRDDYEKEGYEILQEGLYLKEVSGDLWRGKIMLVTDPRKIKILDTPKQYEAGTTLRKMSESAGAIAAVNAGGFIDGPNYDSNGGIPAGLLIKNGVVISPRTITDEVHSMIGLNRDGVLVLRKTDAIWAMNNGIEQAVTFAPFLIVNGERTIKSGTGGWGIAPRTAIGQRPSGELLFLVIDGRQPTWSIGSDLRDLQDVLYDEGCVNAAMLDGGSSTVMIYKGEFVNRPSLGKERFVNNAWGIFE